MFLAKQLRYLQFVPIILVRHRFLYLIPPPFLFHVCSNLPLHLAYLPPNAQLFASNTPMQIHHHALSQHTQATSINQVSPIPPFYTTAFVLMPLPHLYRFSLLKHSIQSTHFFYLHLYCTYIRLMTCDTPMFLRQSSSFYFSTLYYGFLE